MSGMTKVCVRCDERKLMTDFSPDKRAKDGRQSSCKGCCRAAQRAAKDALSPERRAELARIRKETNAAWYAKNRERVRAEARGKRPSPEQIKKQAEWAKANPDRVKASKKRYREKHREKISEYNKIYVENNKGRYQVWVKEWSDRNKHRRRASDAKRNAAEIMATPKWLSREHASLINNIYYEAACLSNETGTPYEVDHIVPLQGKFVCGLHVPWNLRPIPAKDNRSKGNKLLLDAIS